MKTAHVHRAMGLETEPVADFKSCTLPYLPCCFLFQHWLMLPLEDASSISPDLVTPLLNLIALRLKFKCFQWLRKPFWI